jgi:hypothetical protein
MKQSYYYLITSLPELDISDKNPAYRVELFQDFIHEHLSNQDQLLFQTIFYPYDIQNLVAIIKGSKHPLHPFGNFSEEVIREILREPASFPSFFQAFVEDTQKYWERTSAKLLINQATTYFIDWSQHVPNTFLKKWLYFDQNLKNLLIWLNSHKFGLNPVDEVLGNHMEAEYLRSTKPETIDLKAWDFQFREVLRHYDHPNIALRESIINEMRWHYLGEITPMDFGIERILSYAIKLLLIHRNFTDSEESGQLRLNELTDSLLKNYRITEKLSTL